MSNIRRIHPERTETLSPIWKDKVVLITGGTGSFGKKFVEFALKNSPPKKLIIFSRDELKQHEMQSGGLNSDILRYFIGDIRDRDRLHRAMSGVDIVVHAAALKQVPACEYNPNEAILTNIIGTRNILDAAIDSGVEKVLALSTDKAVNPVNLYGATKLCAEKLVVQSNFYAGQKKARFSCVRYGNVVGSRGSVVPVFMKQKETGKISITDPRMSRFWITLDQGVRFVTECLALMNGGEVFVPKIPSTNIMDLAKALAPECTVDYVGIRPGEKLHEVLISEDEARHTVELVDKYVVLPLHPWWDAERAHEGKQLPEGFVYSSDNNTQQMTVAEIKELIDSVRPQVERRAISTR